MEFWAKTSISTI